VLEMTLGALPALPERGRLVVRTDAVGATQDFLAYVCQAGAEFSVGFAIGEPVRKAICAPQRRRLGACSPPGRPRAPGRGGG
jgi:hypothetical protein